jgi:Prokaryotic E2 family E
MALEELRADVAELEEVTGLTVDIVPVGVQVLLVLHEVPLPPSAYRVAATDVLFVTDQQYPMSAMDMFWTEVDVVRPDGAAPQNGDSIETYLDRQWRRFSWHRNGTWNPNRNGLLDHYELMQARFAIDAAVVAR